MPNQCPEGTFPYMIKMGDTFYNLAIRFNTTVEAISRFNPGVNPNALYIGQRICIPRVRTYPNCPGGQVYVVKLGDTLIRIASQFNLSVGELISANPGINQSLIYVGQTICIPMPRTNVYRNPVYNVAFRYPASWRRVDDTRYEGINGFFQIAAISSTGPIDDVCRSEAFHRLMPYGSHPRIIRTTIEGQPACYIFPSADQPADMKRQAALIVKYPRPVQISGETYNYFILWVDEAHIRGIATLLRFIVR